MYKGLPPPPISKKRWGGGVGVCPLRPPTSYAPELKIIRHNEGGAQKNVHPLKAWAQTVLPCLEVCVWGGGGRQQVSDSQCFHCAAPIPVINDRSLSPGEPTQGCAFVHATRQVPTSYCLQSGLPQGLPHTTRYLRNSMNPAARLK